MLKSPKFDHLNQNLTKIIEVNTTLVAASLEAAKQLTFVGCEATRNWLQESANALKALYGATNVEQVTKTVQEYAAQALESSLSNTKQIATVVNSSTETYTGVAHTALKDVQQTMVKSVGDFEAFNPDLSKVVSESLQSFITTSNQAADAVAKVSQQVAEVAHKNLEVATEATLKSVKKAASN
jgi:hypothetical protein